MKKKSRKKSRKKMKEKMKEKMKKSKFKMDKVNNKRGRAESNNSDRPDKRQKAIQHFSTPAAKTITFEKRADTEDEFNKLLDEVSTALDNEPHIVIISMVIPNHRYEDDVAKNDRKRHDGHTFALARDDTTLIVYDSHQVQYMMNAFDPPVWHNYRNLINTMANPTVISMGGEETRSPQDRTIFFFYDIHLFEEVESSCGIGSDGCIEGSCHSYIYALKSNGLLMKPPAAMMYMTDHENNFPPITSIPPKDRNWAGIPKDDRDRKLWEEEHVRFHVPALQSFVFTPPTAEEDLKLLMTQPIPTTGESSIDDLGLAGLAGLDDFTFNL